MNAKKEKMTGMSYLRAVRMKASRERSAASLKAPTSSIRFFHPVHKPVLTMLMPCCFMRAKSLSQTAGFGSRRNLRATSDAMYVVPVTG